VSVAEVVYTSSRDLDCTSARDVLAFVLVRWENGDLVTEPVERMAIQQVMEPHQRAAIVRWMLRGAS
jgi:hypothetical protein